MSTENSGSSPLANGGSANSHSPSGDVEKRKRDDAEGRDKGERRDRDDKERSSKRRRSSHSRSSRKDKDRKDRKRDRDREKDRDRDRDGERRGSKRDREDGERDKDRDRDRKDRSRSKSKSRGDDKGSSRSSRRHSSSSSSSSSSKRRHRSRSPSSERRSSKDEKRRERRDKDKGKEKERDDERSSKDRKRDRESTREQAKEVEEETKEEAERRKKEEEERKLEEERLEEIMRRRKEKLDAWRAQRKQANAETEREEAERAEMEAKRKKWSLEDEDEDEEDGSSASTSNSSVVVQPAAEQPAPATTQTQAAPQDTNSTAPTAAAVAAADHVDELDSFMQVINSEVQQLEAQEAMMGIGAATRAGRGAIPRQAAEPGPMGMPTGNTIRSKLGDRFYAEDETHTWVGDIPTEDDEKKKKRELQPIDHSKINYQPFRRNFYIEVPEIKRMTDEEVAHYRREHLEDVKVRGRRCPKPIKEFSQCGLSSKMYAVMKHCGYERPTPIQAQAIPAIMSGRDIIGCAKTGSGKTLAFVLPMLRHVLDQPRVVSGEGPIALIMVPTRELALQIHIECKKFCKKLGLRSVAVYGGSVVANQISKLKRGAEIVVCTPGRMIDILQTNNGKICNLQRITYLVLDEADRMFDMGFEPQIMRVIEGIRPDRQTVMFSATFPRPVEMAARKILHKPLEIIVGTRSTVCADVEQHVEVRTEETKFGRLLDLLALWKEKGSILIFVDRQESVDEMFAELLRKGYPCLSLHGGHDQADRDTTINDFKQVPNSILIATSVMSRGLDVPELNLVINYDCPNHLEEYVHRVGRTGRAGRKGWAYTFITFDEERFAPDIAKALLDSTGSVPEALQLLAQGFQAKQKAGLAAGHGSGFGGKGFQFTETESNKKKHEIKRQKKLLGIDDVDVANSSDEEEEEEEGEEAAATTAAPKTRRSRALIVLNDKKEKDDSSSSPVVVASRISNLLSQGTSVLDILRLVPNAITMLASVLPPQPKSTQEVALHGILSALSQNPYANIPMPPATEAAAKAALVAFVISMNKGGATTKKEGDKEHFEAELEINDYPQQARWKVTHKDALLQITDITGAAITTRGSYVAPGSAPPLGQRKLYLYIEGPDEAAVKMARAEIKKILEEAAVNARPDRPGGRYKVV